MYMYVLKSFEIYNQNRVSLQMNIDFVFYGVISKEMEECDINNKIYNDIMLMKSTT